MRDEFGHGGRYALAVVLLLFGMWAGLHLPDIDQSGLWLRHFIMHRSILTHGLLIPLFLLVHFYAGGKKRQSDPLPRLALMGFLIGLSAHFAFDLFPQGWRGFALIHIPVYGCTSPLFSQAWLAVSLLLCLTVGCRLLRGVGELYLSLAVLMVALVLAAQTASTTIGPLLALAAAGSLAFVLPRPSLHPTAPGA